jgi:hypothetical protein
VASEKIPTSQIRVGDVVRAYGMRVRIDTIREYAPEGSSGSDVAWSCQGTVLNLDEVRAAQLVPMGWLTRDKWVEGQGWAACRDDAWTVQGNDLATWDIERPEAEAEAGG